MKWTATISFLALMLLGGCASGPLPQTVAKVDLSRYTGTWHEIARFPHSFEKGCVGVTATYEERPDGKIRVVNRCLEGSLTGKERSIEGVARVVNAPANSKLKVSFFWPFEGDYWILRLNDDYSTAAVGSPDRQYLWILHRRPTMPEQEYAALVESLKKDGFQVERLERVPQALQ